MAGSHESARSNEVKVTVPPLSAPVLSATFATLELTSGSADFALQWTSPEPAATKLAFNIYRSTTPGGEGATPYAMGVTGTIAVPLRTAPRHDVLLRGQRRRSAATRVRAPTRSRRRDLCRPRSSRRRRTTTHRATARCMPCSSTAAPIAQAPSYNVYRSDDPRQGGGDTVRYGSQRQPGDFCCSHAARRITTRSATWPAATRVRAPTRPRSRCRPSPHRSSRCRSR